MSISARDRWREWYQKKKEDKDWRDRRRERKRKSRADNLERERARDRARKRPYNPKYHKKRMEDPLRRALHREYGKKWREANPHYFSQYYAKRRGPRKIKMTKKESKLKYLYKLSISDFERMKELQNSKCAICTRVENLCVDHDHETGEIRGLLCRRCNIAIGMLGDNADGIRKALDYLSNNRSQDLDVSGPEKGEDYFEWRSRLSSEILSDIGLNG